MIILMDQCCFLEPGPTHCHLTGGKELSQRKFYHLMSDLSGEETRNHFLKRCPGLERIKSTEDGAIGNTKKYLAAISVTLNVHRSISSYHFLKKLYFG